MDALSALKTMTATTAGAASLNSASGAAGVAGTQPAISAQELQQLSTDLSPQTVSAAQGGDFQNVLGSFVGEVSSKQAAAGDAVSGLLAGKNTSLHQVMISMEEASLSFQMMVEVRNKLLDSYQELMRMQI